MKWSVGILVAVWSSLLFAEVVKEETAESFIKVNMTLELDGVERSIDQTRESLDQIGVALGQIAQSDNLNADQQRMLGDTIENLNQLLHLSKASVESLPQAFERSKQTISDESKVFMDDLRFKVLLVVAAIGLVVVLVIAAIGWFILRPMQSSLVAVTQNIASMAGAIKTTADALDSISNQQGEIAKRLERHVDSADKS
ncbi:hypothetical protein H4F20_07615 [Vibrio sp. 16]|uniref:hypothetical protein n=1 Tax=Vibrio sp. 16 TaxID=391586 RepID=UPI002FEEF818